MTVLTLGPDGEQTCEECAIDFCSSRGYICEARECECLCKTERDRARELDDRPAGKLAVIAIEMDRERYDVEQLMTERFGRKPRAA